RGIDVNLLRPYLNQLDAVAAKQAAATGATVAGQNAIAGYGKAAAGAAMAMARFAGLAGVIGSALSIREISQAADAWTEFQNRLRLVTDSHRELATSTDDVYRVARLTNQQLDSSAQVYQRFAQNAGTLGVSLSQVADLTETVSKAVAVSGASTQAA